MMFIDDYIVINDDSWLFIIIHDESWWVMIINFN